MKTLYPEISTYRTGRLKVSSTHEIYFEESGNPKGKPVVFVHGGPGGGTDGKMRRFFDPNAYRVILFDQRGCGQSTPHASLDENTTWDLVGDMEKLRAHLGIETWQVFGGSWGSTLALAYAETHPERVTELVLRGIFLLRKKEIDWFYQDGAGFVFPEDFDRYRNHIPAAERTDLLAAYHARLTSTDASVQKAAAREWSRWEMATSYLVQNQAALDRADDDAFAVAFARIETHYFVNKGFFTHETQLLDDAHKLANIPTTIVQGRYDVVCPATSAWELKQVMPHAKLVMTLAGHASFDAENVAALVEATDRYAH